MNTKQTLMAALVAVACATSAQAQCLSDAQAADMAFAPDYRRDRMWLWLLAIGLPFAVTGLFKALSYMFGA